MTAMGVTQLPWTSAQEKRAAELFRKYITDIYGHGRVPKGSSARERVFALIARETGRTYSAVENRWRQYGVHFSAQTSSREKVSTPALQEAARRKAAANRLDVTGRVCGDPPPGYSALDAKRATTTAETSG